MMEMTEDDESVLTARLQDDESVLTARLQDDGASGRVRTERQDNDDSPS